MMIGQRPYLWLWLLLLYALLGLYTVNSESNATDSTTTQGQFTSTVLPNTTSETGNGDNKTSGENVNTTQQTTTLYLPDDINKLPCSVMKEYGSWNFQYKYTKEQLRELVCRCARICARITVPPDIRQEIDDLLYGPLSPRNRTAFIVVVTVYSLLFLIGMTGNILTIFGLARWMTSAAPTFVFILSLACSDIFLLLICMPLKVTEYFYLADIFTEVTCRVSYYVRDFTLVCSVLTLTVISFERYYAICHPLKVKYRCTWTRANVMVLMTWLLSALLALPTVFMTKFYLPVGTQRQECLQQSSTDLHLHLYFIYYLGVLFVFPMLIMSYTYGCSCYGLWRSTQRAQEMQGKARKIDGGNKTQTAVKQESVGDLKTRLKVIKLLLLVIAVFGVCWGPSLLSHFLSVLDIISRSRDQIRLACDTLTYVSSTINPFIFMAMSSKFRKYLCWCLRTSSRKRRGIHYQTTFRETTLSSTHINSTSLPSLLATDDQNA